MGHSPEQRFPDGDDQQHEGPAHAHGDATSVDDGPADGTDPQHAVDPVSAAGGRTMSDAQPLSDVQPVPDEQRIATHDDGAATTRPASPAEAVASDVQGFATLGLRAELLAALDELGYEEPTPIQFAAIPPMLAGSDLLGQAATGTGKTAAFALPVLNFLESNRGRSTAPSALVLVPTRELAMQVSEAIFKYGRHLGVKVVPIYGGQPIYRQLQQLDRGVDVVVATPGRAVDHVGRGSLPLDDVRIVVLDEADEMLDMGFADDLETILEATPEERQTVLFSATLPSRINAIAKRYQRDPVRIHIGKGDTQPGEALHPPARLCRAAGAQGRSTRPHPRRRVTDRDDRLLPHPWRGRHADRHDERPRVPGGGAPRRHGPDAARPRHGPVPRRHRRTADRHRRRRTRSRRRHADARRELRRPVGARQLRPPDRPGRPGRPGRCRDHPGRAREQRLLGNIERLTKQQISIETVPTVADLRTRRIATTTESIRAVLADDDLDDLAQIVDDLASEHDLRAIALAAIKLAHDGAADDDDLEIPDARRFDRKDAKQDKGRHRDRDKPGHRGKAPNGSLDERGRDNAQPTGYLYIAMGRSAGMRPGDLVGAIANESGLEGREIGPIRIADHYSVVGVPEREADRVIGVLNGSTIRGKATKVRRYND